MATDLLVVGGGVFGLWTARRAVEAGMSVRLVEARRIGAGASGGVLGALTAHAPDRWDEKKEFQLRALAELPGEVARLEEETGRSCGYRRTGRVMPIRSDAFAAQVERRREGALKHWAPHDPSFVYERRAFDAVAPALAGWLDPHAAPKGVVFDGLAARIAPRAYLASLQASLQGSADVAEGTRFLRMERGAALLDNGDRVAAGHVALAAGFEVFALHPELTPLGAPRGGVKGRSARFRLPGFEDRALLYEDGTYVAPHDDGSVAVGSTDEKDWAGPDADPFEEGRKADGDDAFLTRAAALCPALNGVTPLERWAGVRPKARSRAPLIGPVEDSGRLWVAGGGFKIGFGVAHRLAASLVERIAGSGEGRSAPDRFWTDRAEPKGVR